MLLSQFKDLLHTAQKIRKDIRDTYEAKIQRVTKKNVEPSNLDINIPTKEAEAILNHLNKVNTEQEEAYKVHLCELCENVETKAANQEREVVSPEAARKKPTKK